MRMGYFFSEYMNRALQHNISHLHMSTLSSEMLATSGVRRVVLFSCRSGGVFSPHSLINFTKGSIPLGAGLMVD